MSKRTKLAIFISAAAAVVSAVVLIVVFWDKLLSMIPCCCKEIDACEPEEDLADDEMCDFADVDVVIEAPAAE